MRVHSLESLAAVDGKGLRYAVFLGGCPLRCAYCHNPDTQGCESSREMSAEELLRKIKRYKPYFASSGGGVTFSGGEPLTQAAEIVKLGRLLKDEGIGYILDTSGHVPLTEEVKQAVRSAESVICDLKFYDAERFSSLCGGELSRVTEFLDFLREIQKPTLVRTVIVPSINDSEQEIEKYVKVLAPYREIMTDYELLGFHRLGFFKYEKLGIKNPLENVEALARERLDNLQRYVDGTFYGFVHLSKNFQHQQI